MSQALSEDQFAEVLIISYEYPVLSSGEGEHVLIGQRTGIIAGDDGNVVSLNCEVDG